jgi:hypothetical protein
MTKIVGEIWVQGFYAVCAVTNEIRSFLSDKHNKLFKLYVSCKILELQQISFLVLNLVLFMNGHTFHYSVIYCVCVCVCVFFLCIVLGIVEMSVQL